MSDESGTPGGGEEKENGLGTEGTIPADPRGVGLGAGEPNTFEPEEDPEAAPDPSAADDAGTGFSGHS